MFTLKCEAYHIETLSARLKRNWHPRNERSHPPQPCALFDAAAGERLLHTSRMYVGRGRRLPGTAPFPFSFAVAEASNRGGAESRMSPENRLRSPNESRQQARCRPPQSLREPAPVGRPSCSMATNPSTLRTRLRGFPGRRVAALAALRGATRGAAGGRPPRRHPAIACFEWMRCRRRPSEAMGAGVWAVLAARSGSRSDMCVTSSFPKRLRTHEPPVVPMMSPPRLVKRATNLAGGGGGGQSPMSADFGGI
jgi:hypothetical protein